MENKILILNATVSGDRLIVSFSYSPSAQNYKEYLEKPENSYDNHHEWNLTIAERQVSMNLPPDIAFEIPRASKDAVLAFEDEAKAMKWEENMILWEKSTNQEGTKRSISRSLTVGRLNEKLGLSERTFEWPGEGPVI
ncbi:hypothetical protein N7467_001242 [Penicillium canescens]|nr:hypothetical protein N7467_001242 [Penicillium canescens]